MFEIQDAAKVITESIDPEAKIIFGTVRDDKLKKNEVKITVIATGFPEGNAAARPSNVLGSDTSVSSISRGSEKEKGKIFHSASDSKRDSSGSGSGSGEKVIDIKKPVTPAPAAKPVDDDDDWGAVPAFLRRSRLK